MEWNQFSQNNTYRKTGYQLQANALFLYPLKTIDTSGVSGGTKMEHWLEMN